MDDGLYFTDALDCIETTEPTLRQWLLHRKVKLEHGYGQGWATFTLRDIANLALTRVLATDFNIEVSEAFKIASAVIERWRQPKAKGEGEEFWRGWEDEWLAISRDRKSRKWRFGGLSTWPGTDPAFRARLFAQKASEARNYLHIDVGVIVKSAIDLALERLAARRAVVQRRRA